MLYKVHLFFAFMFHISSYVQASENKEFEMKEDLKLDSLIVNKILLKNLTQIFASLPL